MSSTNVTIPTIPSDWIKHSPVVVQEGYLPRCIVLRPWNDVTPFVTHRAYVMDGKWCYEQGNYCFSRETAEQSFAERAKGA